MILDVVSVLLMHALFKNSVCYVPSSPASVPSTSIFIIHHNPSFASISAMSR